MARANSKAEDTSAAPPAPVQPKSSGEWASEIAALEQERDAIPGKIERLQDAARQQIDDKEIADSFALIEELKQREKVLAVKLYNARRAYHAAALAELSDDADFDTEIEAAAKEVAVCERAVADAIARRDAAKKKLNTLSTTRRGRIMRRQELQGELGKLERSVPAI